MSSLDLMSEMIPVLLEMELDSKTQHDVIWMALYCKFSSN